MINYNKDKMINYNKDKMINYDKTTNTFYVERKFGQDLGLHTHGWIIDSVNNIYYTTDHDRVAPFVEHFSPELMKLIKNTADEIETSSAVEPSENFIPIIPSGRKLFPHQAAAVEYILSRGGNVLLAEEAGLGKTAICLTAINHLQPENVLILCPASVKYNWAENEAPKWLVDPSLRNNIHVVNADDWDDTAKVVIMNPALLLRHKPKLDKRHWGVIIVDESHRVFKNMSTQAACLVWGGQFKIKKERALKSGLVPGNKRGYYKSRRLSHDHIICGTGTPMNRPKDLWGYCRIFDPKRLGNNIDTFAKRYCARVWTPFGGYDDSGADNLEELGGLMRARFMVRHDPAILNLPPLIEQLVVLPPIGDILTEEQEFVNSNMDALLGLSETMNAGLTSESTIHEFMGLVEQAAMIGKPEFKPLFTMYSAMRKMTGLAKVPAIVDYLDDKVDLGEPVVCMVYHREVLDGLLDFFVDAAYVKGGMSARARTDMINRFQNGETNVFLGTIDAAGEGITLTRSSYICIAEQDWKATGLLQVKKRIHRITQTKTCVADWLCAKGSFDFYVMENASEKMENISQTLDCVF